MNVNLTKKISINDEVITIEIVNEEITGYFEHSTIHYKIYSNNSSQSMRGSVVMENRDNKYKELTLTALADYKKMRDNKNEFYKNTHKSREEFEKWNGNLQSL